MEPNNTSALPVNKVSKKTSKSIEERPQNAHYSDVQRLQALALYEAGIPAATAAERAGIKSAKTVSNILKKAQSRGYDRNVSTILKLEYVSDGAKSGRPRKSEKAEVNGIAHEAHEAMADTGQLQSEA